MATPTPSTNTPQKQLHAFSSPAPRSVPPMVNFDSPAALGLLTEGGVGMGISMSGLGLGMTASALGRADEEERRRRLESIISMLKKKPGRVSEEGIMRLCKQENLEVMPEGPPHSRVLLLLIGDEAMCEVPVRFGEVVVEEVKLAVNSDRHNYSETGSTVLRNSLRPLPGTTKINLTLDRFSNNLEKLLRMDKLSAPKQGGVSCYQAIFGVYESLKKLFEHEKKMALTLLDANSSHASHQAEREVLCKKSGRPRINAGTCLGVSLEYWMDRRHIIPPPGQQASSSPKGKDAMDIDSERAQAYPEDQNPETNKIYSLTIECESSPSSMYSPIRISDAWISDAIEKAPGTSDTDINNLLLNQPTLDWLEPPPTYLPPPESGDDHDAMNIDAAPGRLPNIRFVAKFYPPLTVPLSVYVSMLQSVGLEVPHADIRATTYVGLVLRPGDPDPGLTGTAGETTQEIKSTRTVLTFDDSGAEKHTTHTNSLYVPKIEYSRTIDALPFQHPRQLIEILPILRQYAFTTSLLQNTFGANDTKEGKHPSKSALGTPLSPPQTPQAQPSHPETPVDITLSYSPPAPRVRLDVPHPLSALPSPSSLSTSTSQTQRDQTNPLSLSNLDLNASPDALLEALLNPQIPTTSTTSTAGPQSHYSALGVTLDVLANAELSITEQNVITSSSSSTNSKSGAAKADKDSEAANMGLDTGHGVDVNKVKRVARALDVCGDIGIWAEWVRREAGRSAAS
ncbi:hypothetical protein BU24DRAFT_416615 [Aaosphaeria arxii CBS 175.79]|uniref:Mediator of RNA polymerase II transcription subunit 1 n=1 Tax=Aaosphaeria arxii CBS 175.79 TaxID=1450172 RepID=A0A6A5Y6V3_9PLEO|nr:uncharacterized protein BU24DRAFT_416615 [Aaosphaeria arxii CBS 175.79]KAF2020953.1 hypothetical protein BU24DRAFT_416615 [Aaosphaeria arxii CBS 175.79]